MLPCCFEVASLFCFFCFVELEVCLEEDIGGFDFIFFFCLGILVKVGGGLGAAWSFPVV